MANDSDSAQRWGDRQEAHKEKQKAQAERERKAREVQKAVDRFMSNDRRHNGVPGKPGYKNRHDILHDDTVPGFAVWGVPGEEDDFNKRVEAGDALKKSAWNSGDTIHN